MKLSQKNAARHREILRRVKAGLPLAGLLTGMTALSGCTDAFQVVGNEPNPASRKPDVQRLAGDEPAPLQGLPPPKCPASQSNRTSEAAAPIEAVGIEPKRK